VRKTLDWSINASKSSQALEHFNNELNPTFRRHSWCPSSEFKSLVYIGLYLSVRCAYLPAHCATGGHSHIVTWSHERSSLRLRTVTCLLSTSVCLSVCSLTFWAEAEVTGHWRRLRNYLHSPTNIIRLIKWMRMRWAVHVARVGEEKCLQNFVGKLWGKWPLERLRCRWEDSIQMDLRELDWKAWTGLISVKL
jgi:hypothetical protein